MTHLGDRVAALVDGELDHHAREKAFAHLAHCPACRAEVEAHRGVKRLLLQAGVPEPPGGTVPGLLALAAPGGPLPPRSRSMPLGPVVPDLPAPGRRTHSRRAHPRARLVAAGTLAAAGLVLGTAFLAGGSSSAPVVPPVAELSVEHSRTSTAVTVGDPGLGLMTGLTTGDAGSTGTGVLRR